MSYFRKKPVVIEAVHFDGSRESLAEVMAFTKGMGTREVGVDPESGGFTINTLEGTMLASPGDWVIKGVKGEFYPCKPDIFEATYEPVEAL